MDGPGSGAEHQPHHTNPRPEADHPPQQTRRLSDQPFDPPHRRFTGPALSGHSIPALPDESTIRANVSVPVLKPFQLIIADTTESSSSPETYYPRVRYIFADDDPDLLTDAFEAQHGQTSPETSNTRPLPPGTVLEAHNHDAPSRPILLDLELASNGRGFSVASATSLAADWAVTDAKVQRLQTSPSDDSEGSEGDHTMILRVEGLSLPALLPLTAGQPPASSLAFARGEVLLSQDGKMLHHGRDYGDLVRSFEGRMALLQRIMHSSEVAYGYGG